MSQSFASNETSEIINDSMTLGLQSNNESGGYTFEHLFGRFTLYSSFFIAAFIALFSILDEGSLVFILKSKCRMFFLVLLFMLGVGFKSVLSFLTRHHLLDLISVPILGVISLLTFIFCIYPKPLTSINKERVTYTRYWLICNLIFVVGWVLAGAVFWFMLFIKII